MPLGDTAAEGKRAFKNVSLYPWLEKYNIHKCISLAASTSTLAHRRVDPAPNRARDGNGCICAPTYLVRLLFVLVDCFLFLMCALCVWLCVLFFFLLLFFICQLFCFRTRLNQAFLLVFSPFPICMSFIPMLKVLFCCFVKIFVSVYCMCIQLARGMGDGRGCEEGVISAGDFY